MTPRKSNYGLWSLDYSYWESYYFWMEILYKNFTPTSNTRVIERPCREGAVMSGSHVTCRNVKMSRFGVLTMLRVAAGNRMKIICLCVYCALSRAMLWSEETEEASRSLKNIRMDVFWLLKVKGNRNMPNHISLTLTSLCAEPYFLRRRLHAGHR